MSQASKDSVRIGNQKRIAVSLVNSELNYDEQGELKLVEVFADESTDSVRLRALFPNAERKLIPGMFVNAKLHLQPFDAITIPQKATSRAPDGNLIVFVVDKDNIAKARTIKASQIFGDEWIVSEGLEDGEMIIYEGLLKVDDGVLVNPILKDNCQLTVDGCQLKKPQLLTK